MAKKKSKRDQALRRSYDFYIELAVKDYLRHGYFDTSYHYNRGVAFGYGYALGYEHVDIVTEIDTAIAEAAEVGCKTSGEAV